MKKVWIWLLILALMVVSLPAYAGEEETAFTLVSTGNMTDLDAETHLYEHNETKAQVLFILNDDPNRGFAISFATEPTDDTGVLHVLEHASCASSEKYPSQDVFFDASNQTYLTYINAFTSQRSTAYLTSSMSEDQLYALTDMYLDCCFHSSLRTEPNYFSREGWRYELSDAEGDITINGIVYNEMQGVYSNPTSVAWKHMKQSLFPDTYQGKDAGGDPAVIPTLSYEECISFYDECYHPSNSLTVFYGDVEEERFLSLLNDGYFDQYTYQASDVPSTVQSPFEAPVTVEVAFPVSADTEDTSATLLYAWAVEDTQAETYYSLMLLSHLLNDESSETMTNLYDSGIGEYYEFGTGIVGQQYVFYALATDADATQADAFAELANSELRSAVEAGFSEEIMDGILAAIEFEMVLTRNSSNVAIGVLERIGNAVDFGDVALFDVAAGWKALEERAVPGYMEGITESLLLDNPHAVMVSVVPEPGLLEKNMQQLADQLAEKKAAMTDEEITALVASCEAFDEWNSRGSNEDTVAKLKAVTADTLPLEMATYPINEKTIEGVTVMTAQVEGIDASYTKLSFPVDHLSTEQLHHLKLYLDLLGYETENLSRQEAFVKSLTLINGFSASIQYQQQKGSEDYTIVLDIGFFAMNDSYDEALAYVWEMLTETLVAESYDKLEQSIQQSLSAYQYPESAMGQVSSYAVSSYDEATHALIDIAGLGYYQAVSAFQAALEETSEAMYADLVAARDAAFTNGLVITWTGDASAVQIDAALTEVITALPNAREKTERTLSEIQPRAAFVMDVSGCYVYFTSGLRDVQDLETQAALLVASQMLNNEYLLTEIRLRGGAYGGSMNVSVPNSKMMMNSYRDVDFTRTLQVFQNAGDFLSDLDITEEMLDNYKLAALSNITAEIGALNDAAKQIDLQLQGYPSDYGVQIAEAIQAITMDDMVAVAVVLEDAVDRASYTVIASADAVAENENLFDEVHTLP